MKKVTVVGAGKYGSMTALRVAEYDLVDSVVMTDIVDCLLYTSPSPRDKRQSRMPSSA